MADSANNTQAAQASEKKEPFSKGLKAEFKKIIWPTKSDLTKQTVAVVVITIILGLLITLIDSVLQVGINFIVG